MCSAVAFSSLNKKLTDPRELEIGEISECVKKVLTCQKAKDHVMAELECLPDSDFKIIRQRVGEALDKKEI